MPRKVISTPLQAAAFEPRDEEADSSARVHSSASGSLNVNGLTDDTASDNGGSSSNPPVILSRSFGSRSALLSSEGGGASLVSGNAATISTSPSVIVHTNSVKRGHRLSYDVKVVDENDKIVSKFEVSSNKQLRKQLGETISEHGKVRIDLSQRWGAQKSADARVAQLPGLLKAATVESITIDLSNYRPAALREGAEIRLEKGLKYRDWRQAFKDVDVGLLVASLITELERSSANPGEMPDLELVCHDQPLHAAIYPLVKCLAANAESLLRLKRLDLNRYSRSEEICGAILPTDSARVKAYDKFIDRIAQLLEHSPSLIELGLRMNGVDSFALSLIADALADNRVLQKLDLSGNPLGIETSEARPSWLGIRVLAKALRRRSGVKNLDLSFCGLDGRAADILVRAIAQNKNLEQVNLGGNPIPPGHAILDDPRVVRLPSVRPAD